jgi:hypothetical protein
MPAAAPKAKVVPKYDPLLGEFVDSATGIPIPKKTAPRPALIDPKDFKLDTRSVFDKDQSIIMDGSRRISKDKDGYLVTNAGRKQLEVNPRKTYRRGTWWIVRGENVRIEAMCNYGAGANGHMIWSGWSRRVEPGTVLECIGWRRFRKDGLVAPQFVYPELPHEARWSTVWPTDSVFRSWPLTGMLEQITPEEAERLRAGHNDEEIPNDI